MAKPRKRQPGGGRKPRGLIHGKAEVFSTRIRPETRAAMEREATKADVSLSQMAEMMIVESLRARRLRSSNKQSRALCFLIERLALHASGVFSELALSRGGASADAREQLLSRWRTDPFRYEAFKIATNALLNFLQPDGEIVRPKPEEESVPNDRFFQKMYDSPQSFADQIMFFLAHPLVVEHQLTRAMLDDLREVGLPGSDQVALQELHGMQQARRDLGIEQDERKARRKLGVDRREEKS